MDNSELIKLIKLWLHEAGRKIRKVQEKTLTIDQKKDRKDLVTNVDREIQAFLIRHIHAYNPESKILAEEEGYSELDDFTGQVFVVDPIDGTLNFVLEQENFCIMLGVYENGVGQLGFIYDVMTETLYWGGKKLGVYKNDQLLPRPQNQKLEDGLIGVNGYLFSYNRWNIRTIGEKSMGVRIYGCAGIELIALIKGKHVGYIANLSPWDYGAGNVLLEELGLKYSGLSGEKLKFHGREYYLAATPQAYEEIRILIDTTPN
ncbi:MAG: inositol monophosphatase family protein [Enterococcus lacertideformus]|uniref:Inositol monophosphatase family protein n=1 Tax=Enterococcus lacertideformus TaxID=2771493 RepID=A0A931AYW3_9ENTE|nr:inositol monophosphatase family protein [Enterococcus lacertideformus]